MKPTILLVEDDEDDVFFFKDALQQLNTDAFFHTVPNGLEAIKKLDELIPVKPNLIFLDLNMPIMNGFELLAVLKREQRLKDIPVFVLTTSDDVSTKTNVLKTGVVEYFTKPSSVEELKTIITKATRILTKKTI